MIRCHPSYLSDIENRRRVPSDQLLRRMAEALKVSVDALEGRNEDPILQRIIDLLDGLPESVRAEALAAVARIAENIS